KTAFEKGIICIILTISLLAISSFCFAGEVPFTLEDRDRLIKLETKVEEGFKNINQRIDALDKRIDGLQGLMYVVISGIFILIGFVIWDRRTALAPAIRKNKELEEREEKIEKALKELAKKDPTVAEVLRNVGLL
ncbi:MAG: hypothetical protein WHS38_01740, partial [Thermodesulforhabdaceae bacterium]